MLPSFGPPVVSTAIHAWCSIRMLPFSVGRLTSQVTTLSMPGWRRAALLTCIVAPQFWPASVERRKSMSLSLRSAHVTTTEASELTAMLHPNGARPWGAITCSLVHVVPPLVERATRSSLVSAVPSRGLLVSTNRVQQM